MGEGASVDKIPAVCQMGPMFLHAKAVFAKSLWLGRADKQGGGGVVVQYQHDYLVVADTLLLATPIFNTLSPRERELFLDQTPMPPPMSYRDGEGFQYLRHLFFKLPVISQMQFRADSRFSSFLLC